MSALPAYATPRTSTRRTAGGPVARISRALGAPPMPWQRALWDVGLEKHPDGSWAYTDVIASVPRQAGKTTALHPVFVHRAATSPMARCWLTAQSRQDARDILVDDWGPRFTRSPLATLGKLRRSQGSEGFYFRNGAAARVFAPGEEALHGKANELVATDEIWVWDDVEEAGLTQAILPTFTTTGGQWWKTSTAGTASSTMLARAVQRGRAAVAAGVTEGVCYVEYSLPDSEVDAVTAGLLAGEGPLFERGLQLLLAAHPGAGYTLRLPALRDAVRLMRPGEVLRAYGNRQTVTTEQVIPADRWADSVPATWPRPTGPLALAVDVDLDSTSAAIVACWRGADGRLHVDVVDARDGSSWVPGRLLELQSDLAPVAIGHDSTGPVVDVADQAARLGVQLVATKTAEFLAACQGLLVDVVDDRLRHPGHPVLDAAVRAAGRRTIGEGWAWGRRASAGSIAALVAASVGRWVLDHAVPEPVPAFRYLETEEDDWG